MLRTVVVMGVLTIALVSIPALSLWHQTYSVEVHVEAGGVYLNRSGLEGALNRQAEAGASIRELKQWLLAQDWVEHADLYYQQKNSVRVDIQEFRPIARLGGGTLLNSSGREFVVKGKLRTELPLLLGPQGVDPEWLLRHYMQVREVIALEGWRVKSLELTIFNGWEVRLLGGGGIVFGHGDFQVKLQRLRHFIDLKSDLPSSIWVHMNYGESMAVSMPGASG